MKRLALAALLAAAALASACGRSPAAPDARQPPAGAVHDGFLGSGNHHDTTTYQP
ncbi:MAG TPA: hypothetical protein VGO40_15095 [Longimicrobium sp.]|jgi:opacity protein-like surface antigen|nr:hypothetical protein [Longimicrobium sp.]